MSRKFLVPATLLLAAACASGDYEVRQSSRLAAAEARALDVQLELVEHRRETGRWPDDVAAFAVDDADPEYPFALRVDAGGAIHVDFGGNPRRSDLAGHGFSLHPLPGAGTVAWRCENRGFEARWIPRRCRGGS